MNFTVVFRGNDNTQMTYTLAYEPSPIWKQGEEWILNLNPESPNYKLGSVNRLMATTGLSFEAMHKSKDCFIICESNCINEPEIQKLHEDLKREGFNVKVFGF